MNDQATLCLVSCYNCGSDESSLYASENGFNLVRCGECGLLYVNRRPSDEAITQAHQLGIHRGERSLDVTGRFNDEKVSRYQNILSDLYCGESVESQRTWLDIGCGHGEFLMALTRFGRGRIRARGIEPNPGKRKSACQRGLDVDHVDLNTIEEAFGGVSLLNVYSHLPDPPAFITRLRRLVKPGGEILLQTGDTAGLSSKDHYRPFYLPDHLSFASEQIVTGILERAGFEVIATRKYSFIPLNIPSLVKELIKIALPRQHSRLRYLFKGRMVRDTDMIVRARAKS